RSATAACARRLSHARLCAVWQDLVSIFYATSGGAPRQRLVRVEEHAQGLNGRRRDVERGGEHDRVIGAHPTRAHGAALMEDYIWIIWVVLGVVLMVAELFTPGFVLLWFGIGAIAAALMSLAG